MSSGRKERTKVNAKISLTYFQTGSLQKKKKKKKTLQLMKFLKHEYI